MKIPQRLVIYVVLSFDEFFNDLLGFLDVGSRNKQFHPTRNSISRPENLGDLSLISETLAGHGTELIVDSRTFDLAEDTSVLMLDFEGVLAKHFRRQLLRNMDRGKVRKAEMGRKAGGADVFGYRTNEKGEYVPEPNEAKIVQLIFKLATNDHSFRNIRVELNRRNILTKRGRQWWSIAVIGEILRNDIYLGVYRFHKSKHDKDVDGSRYVVRRKEQIVAGSRDNPNHPPIIEGWIFDAVQQKIQANRKKNTLTPEMATGLLRCRLCSAGMRVKYSTGPRGKRIVKYVCTHSPQCGCERIPVAETNQRLWSALVHLFTQPDRISSLLLNPGHDQTGVLKDRVAELEGTANAVATKQDRLLNLYLEGRLSKAVYDNKNHELERSASGVRSELIDVRKRIDQSSKRELETELIHTLRILSRSHRRFTHEQKVRVFRSIVKAARLNDSSVELDLYVNPVHNYQWKYRQEQKPSPARAGFLESLQLQIPIAVTTADVQAALSPV